MTSGARWLPRAGLLMLAVMVSMAASAAQGGTDLAATSTFDIHKLMAGFHKVSQATGQFTERKYVSMLNEPLESSGTLVYFAPDHLEKYTSQPYQERLIVNGDTIVVDQGEGQVRTLSIEESPELGALIESIRGTLSGNAAILERFYSLELQGTNAAWTFTLTPKSKQMRALVQSIHIVGIKASIRTIETRERSGDYSVMTIAEAGQ